MLSRIPRSGRAASACIVAEARGSSILASMFKSGPPKNERETVKFPKRPSFRNHPRSCFALGHPCTSHSSVIPLTTRMLNNTTSRVAHLPTHQIVTAILVGLIGTYLAGVGMMGLWKKNKYDVRGKVSWALGIGCLPSTQVSPIAASVILLSTSGSTLIHLIGLKADHSSTATLQAVHPDSDAPSRTPSFNVAPISPSSRADKLDWTASNPSLKRWPSPDRSFRQYRLI